MMFRIATFNVNSIRVRLDSLKAWLDATPVDVVAFQETKVIDQAFPYDFFQSLGYHVYAAGQATYNGVAFASRYPLQDIHVGLPHVGFYNGEQRLLAASLPSGCRLINVYVPNGREVGHSAFDAKLEWLADLRSFIQETQIRYSELLLLGDFNIAPEDRDVCDPEHWKAKVLCTDAERAALASLFDLGLEDSFRWFVDDSGHYSWWDYRSASFRRNLGLRIDLILASAKLRASCVAAGIDSSVRALERPSDHAPVWLALEGMF